MAINPSAYQGKGWRPRTARLADELARAGAPRVNSEYKRLKAVLLYCPGSELAAIKDPNAAQHLARIDPLKISREYKALAAAFKKCGVAVHMIKAELPGRKKKPDKYNACAGAVSKHGVPQTANACAGAVSKHGVPRTANLMYVRDLFVNTMEGAVLARMASAVRAGEEKYAAFALAGLDIPIARTVTGRGLFEGADALWLDGKTMLCGAGNRTNREGFLQLKQTMALQGVEVISAPMPGGVQHLLGLLQIVDRRLALLRAEKAPAALKALLKRKGFRLVPVAETDEVKLRQGMNVVTVAPRRLIMPAGCPGLKALYLKAGLSVAAEVKISQLINGAGGIACATGILAREV